MSRRCGFRSALAALVAVGLAACATFGGGKAEPAPRLDFLDSQIFDDRLHASLAESYPTVTIAFRGSDVTVNSIPERLDKWLYVIAQKGEERVRVLPDPAHPAPKNVGIGVAVGLAVAAYGKLQNYLFYAPVREYDAAVYYAPSEGTITRVVFVRRPE